MKNTLKIGIVGLGRIGQIHLANIATRVKNAEVVAAADITESLLDFARRHGVENVSTNPEYVLTHPDVEAVVICTPTPTHVPYTILAAQHGKHIFCEKPLDLSIEQILVAKEAVELANVQLMLGFNRRFDANFLKVKEMVHEGLVGDPHILKITSRDPNPPQIEYVKSSGGLFLDMAIHDFDMARYVMNSEVTEVYAKAKVLVDPRIGAEGDIDTAITTLTFANGAIGVIDNSRKAVYGYDQRIEVFGSGGMTQTKNNTPDTHEYYNDKGGHLSLPLNFFLERYAEAYVNEINVFVSSVLAGENVPVNAHDGLMATAIAMAAKQSYMEDRPVKIEEILSAITA
ncbi:MULTISPECIES: inositol 2-dehydrogenase [Emticicia]|uniref:inositol 2-dehydrogenase n=1 Tax=Emticicia TaxID=312278 RepID=UPI0020A083CC|nr:MULTISPECIES: inositol 2-dehydrogenase [Emticicia]UTA69710.1 inositol 2-dehydrogenase [Emticicia sp. 21SJ11W-3]